MQLRGLAMSDDALYDPDWWRDAKASSLKRKARRSSQRPSARPGDAFLIVTEGTVTEPIYFNLLLRDLQLAVVRVKVVPGHASDPRHVIKCAEWAAREQIRKARKGQLGVTEPPRFDHIWAVVDTDVAARMGFWNDVEQLARSRKVALAHSTPCFEFWLLLHIAGYTTRQDLFDGDCAKAAVRSALGCDYSTNKEVAGEIIPKFLGKWVEAVRHAQQVRKHHDTASTPPPANPSTEVDILVRALNDSALEQVRKL